MFFRLLGLRALDAVRKVPSFTNVVKLGGGGSGEGGREGGRGGREGVLGGMKRGWGGRRDGCRGGWGGVDAGVDVERGVPPDSLTAAQKLVKVGGSVHIRVSRHFRETRQLFPDSILEEGLPPPLCPEVLVAVLVAAIPISRTSQETSVNGSRNSGNQELFEKRKICYLHVGLYVSGDGDLEPSHSSMHTHTATIPFPRPVVIIKLVQYIRSEVEHSFLRIKMPP